MASIAAELPPYSKLGKVFALELGRHTMVGEDPNGTSESKGNSDDQVSSNTHTLGSR